MYNTILPFLLLLLMPLGASAQFYTISKASDSVQVLSSKKIQIVANEHIFGVNTVHKVRTDSLPPLVAVKEKQLQTDQKSDKRTSQNKAIPIMVSRHSQNQSSPIYRNLPFPISIRKSSETASSTQGLYWHKPSLKRAGSVRRSAATGTTCSD